MVVMRGEHSGNNGTVIEKLKEKVRLRFQNGTFHDILPMQMIPLAEWQERDRNAEAVVGDLQEDELEVNEGDDPSVQSASPSLPLRTSRSRRCGSGGGRPRAAGVLGDVVSDSSERRHRNKHHSGGGGHGSVYFDHIPIANQFVDQTWEDMGKLYQADIRSVRVWRSLCNQE